MSVLLLLACAPESTLYTPPLAAPESVQVDPADLTSGVRIEPLGPVRSARWTLTADPGTTVSLATSDGTGWTGAVPLVWDEVLGEVRNTTLWLPEGTEILEITADGPVSFLQVELFADAPIFDDDFPDGLASAGAGRAIPGWWAPGADLAAIGETMYLPYTDATACSGGARPGTLALADFLKSTFGADSYGIYSCRTIVGGTGLSVHSEGRAIDLMIGPDGGALYPENADNDRGDPVAAFLIAHAEAIGASYFIWDRGSWGAHRSGEKHDYYGGLHPHNDHLHIELTPEAAETLTAAFLGTLDAPAERTGWVAMAAEPDGTGYWLAHTDGTVAAFEAPYHGDAANVTAFPVVDIAAGPTGYWLAAEDGGVFSFGEAFHGSLGGVALNAPVTALTSTPDGGGYWLAAEDGGVFAFGNAGFHGSMGGVALNAPVVDLAATPSGGGYWLVAEDGGIFAFGDAGFYGSMGGVALNAPVIGMAATPTGLGYWLVAEDGGIFAFGDAAFHGSMGGTALVAPMSGIAAGPGGYWTSAFDGGVFSFGTAFHGSAVGAL